jgi:hypothetical protein
VASEGTPEENSMGPTEQNSPTPEADSEAIHGSPPTTEIEEFGFSAPKKKTKKAKKPVWDWN